MAGKNMPTIPRDDGRRVFGEDPEGYAAARPDYPDALYAGLVTRCGLGPGTATFEIGPGTGLATRRLLALGARPLVAIEPDPRLAQYLAQTLTDAAIEIEQAPFEQADLPAAGFDLGVAATSFHWLDQGAALAKVRQALKPGGWWAMWWNHFGAGGELDSFVAATRHLFAGVPDSPSQGDRGHPPLSLNREARLQDMIAAGLTDARAELWRWTRPYDAAALVALYRTFSPLRVLAPDQREHILSEIARIAENDFGGRVERMFTTALYTARRPRH
jgi:SAM-dependent methyltransferase